MAKAIRVSRSGLIMPVNVPRFVDRAWSRNSDTIILDLEDAVAPAEKASARTMVKEAIAKAARGGADVSVRINHEFPLEDCQASVWPGLGSISYTKTETAEEIKELDQIITRVERERGMAPGTVSIGAAIETARGVWDAYDIATASSRVRGFGGVAEGDLTADLGVPIEVLWEVDVLAYGRGECDLIARALGREIGGKLWSPGRVTIADYGDAESLIQSNRKSFRAGYRGGGGIHPAQVEAANRGFTPTPEEVAQAQEVAAAYQQAYARGEAYAVYQGRIVDARVSQAAQELVDFAQACAQKDATKSRLTAQMRAQEPG